MRTAVARLRPRVSRAGARKTLIDDGLLLGLTAFLTVGGLGLANGGYFPVSWGWCALGLLVVVGAALILGVACRPQPLGLALLIFLAGLTAWTAASTAWTLNETHTVNEVERLLIYLSAAVCGVVLLRRTSGQALILGTWAAIAVLSGYGLAIWLFPQHLGFEDSQWRYRLAAPVGYWNAFGILVVIGILLALGLAARAKALLRALAAASTVVLAVTLYLTFSRGAWVALGAGLVMTVALDRRRLQLILTACALAPWAALGVFAASRSDALTHANAPLDAVAHDGHGLAVIVIGLAAIASFVILLLDTAEARIQVPRRAAQACAVLIVLVVAAGLSAVFVRYGSPPTLVERAYDSFNSQVPANAADLNARLFSLSANGREAHWHTAWEDATNHPWLGSGAGSFDVYWFEHREVAITVHDAHSLYLETLAELGPVGLLLLLGALAIPLVAVVHARRHPLAAAAFGAFVAFLLHAAVDWDWEMPAVTLAALFCGLALLAAARQGDAAQSLSRAARTGGLVATLGVGAFVVLTLVGNSAVSASSQATRAGSYGKAKREARQAMDFLPWSSEPWRRLGEAQAAQGDLVAARVSFKKALSKEPDDWTLWFDLAQVSSGTSEADALARALRLNPRSPELAAWKRSTHSS